MSSSSSSWSSFAYIALWIFTSCTMILFNKAVLSNMNFPFPMFLTAWHMLFATVLTQILARTTDMLPGVKEGKVDWEVIKKQVIPVALFYSLSLVLSNKAYIYLSVAYIQMLKAFTPVAVLGMSVIFGLERSSFIEANIVAIISVGVAMTSLGELQFSLVGFLFQFAAIFMESSRLVMTNVLLKQLKLDSLSTLYYIAPICFVFITVACAIFEFSSLPLARMATFQFEGIMILNGLVAFSLNIASVLLISHTSALVLTLAGVFKDILLVVLSMVVLESPVSLLQYLGYSVALLGLNLHKEFKKNAATFTGPTSGASSNSQNETELTPMKVDTSIGSSSDNAGHSGSNMRYTAVSKGDSNA